MIVRNVLLGVSLVWLAVWTVFCLGLWASFAYGTDLLHWLVVGSSQGAPAPGGAFSFFQGLGGFLIFLGWAIGAAIMAGAMLLFRNLREGPVVVVHAYQSRTLGGWGEQPMKDVTPPRDQTSRPA